MQRSELGIIAGPCSIHSLNQGLEAARMLQPEVTAVRLPPVKPRTNPMDWPGMGKEALPILKQIKELTGCRLAMEATTARDTAWMLEVAQFLWLGARQNPNNTREIIDILRGVEHIVMFAVKNPLAPDEKAWISTIEACKKNLHPAVKIAAIHRGFFERTKPNGWRNNPDFEMAARVKNVTGAELYLDLSHLVGERELIIRLLLNGSINWSLWDGLMLEVDPDPTTAKTDATQQLTINEALPILRTIKNKRRQGVWPLVPEILLL